MIAEQILIAQQFLIAQPFLTAEQIETVLGLYNYWIVIFLMMTGFYIVIARNNLIKTVIGLNIFQISVILLYVTIGKIAGGTAPIVPPSMVSHGHEHVEHADHGPSSVTHGRLTHADKHENDHASIHESHQDEHSKPSTLAGSPRHVDHSDEHDLSDDGDDLVHAEPPKPPVYSNPLPSVLMLTAIVVGVATTALALALIVRIREDYGTIEEDEILELDRAA